jgi:uncharacterized protein
MNALYECSVFHSRLKPKHHKFNYRVFMFCVDLTELPSLSKRLCGFSHNRWNIFSIDDRDHVDLGHLGGIRANFIAWLAEQGVACPDDATIQLLTFPRVLGYGFNPVSFYDVRSNTGEPIIAVAEVVNTFREMKLYAMGHRTPEGVWERRVAKNFYVSPFSDPGDEFDFKLGDPGASWRVAIDSYAGDERYLLSAIQGERRTLTTGRLLWYGLKYPLLSLKIIGLIHWHALLLWMKRVPFFRKHDRPEAQLAVMRPHSSLNKTGL